MKLSKRSYPHPVVGNADDVPGADFQATFEFSSDKTNFYFSVAVRCSSRTLLKLIKKQTACYSIHVECSNTLFRHAYDFFTDTFQITIPATHIHDTVEVNGFIRATADLPLYSMEGLHDDYGSAEFEVSAGDILAIADGQTFDADHTVDPLRRVGSMMVVIESSKPGDHPMEVATDEDKIRIVLCKSDFAAYFKLKGVQKLTDHLSVTLVLPVLIHAIQLLDRPDEVQGLKWAERLQTRLDALPLSTAADTLEKAQRILDMPIHRALAAAVVYAENQSPVS